MKYTLPMISLIMLSMTTHSHSMSSMSSSSTSQSEQSHQIRRAILKQHGIARVDNHLEDRLFALSRNGNAEEIGAVLDAGAHLTVSASRFDRLLDSGELLDSFPADGPTPITMTPLHEAAR